MLKIYLDNTNKIKQKAIELGFELVGICSADPIEDERQHLLDWLQKGFHGGMGYLARDPERKINPQQLLPTAKSILSLGMNYYPGDFPDGLPNQVSRYAWGEDYHHVIGNKLQDLELFLKTLGDDVETKSYVDTGALMEKAIAKRAGLGFIGKNTNLIHPKKGSWFFLAEILTNLELVPDTPIHTQCGTCNRCIEACPTGAIIAPYVLDARRCISYLTIEHKGPIPEEFHVAIQPWVFGCDICQEVCPFNHKAQETLIPEFLHIRNQSLDFAELSKISSPGEFKTKFHNTPLLRPKLDGLKRNLLTSSKE
jgi:epoxyqueuosine reductase